MVVRMGIAVGGTIMLAGALIFRDSSEAVLQAVAMVGMFTGLAVGMFLDGRARKRKERSQ